MPIIVPEPAPVEAVAPGSTLIASVWDALPEYVTDADTDGTLYTYLDSAVYPAENVVALLTSGSGMVDPATAPTNRLSWIAALAGIDLTSVPAGDRRTFIGGTPATGGGYDGGYDADYADIYTASGTVRVPLSRFRGCRAAIEQRVGLTLTGSRTVQVECPYESDPLAILVRVFAPECADSAVTEAAARAEVPAWLALTFDVATGIDYDALAVLYPTYDDMTASGLTYAQLAALQP